MASILTVFGHLYLSLLGIGIGLYQLNPHLLVVFLSLVWQSDSGGLVFGSRFGTAGSLGMAISPAKTRAGTLGSYIMSMASALGMWVIGHNITDIMWMKL